MNLILLLKTYGMAVVVFFALDILWLGLVARKYYKSQLGHLMRDSTNWPAAIIFYLLFICGIVYFAIYPALEQKSLMIALKNGVLFGFFTYMTYELTNFAVIKEWPVSIIFVDILWGMILCGGVAVLTYLVVS